MGLSSKHYQLSNYVLHVPRIFPFFVLDPNIWIREHKNYFLKTFKCEKHTNYKPCIGADTNDEDIPTKSPITLNMIVAKKINQIENLESNNDEITNLWTLYSQPKACIQ